MQLHEGLESKGPAPIPASIKEHTLLQDRFKGRKKEIYGLSSVIIGKVIENWMVFHSGLNKLEPMSVAEASGNWEDENTREIILDYYVPMEPDEVLNEGDVIGGIASGVKVSLEWSLDELFKEWRKKEKGEKNSAMQDVYDRFIYLTSQLGIDAREFLTGFLDIKLEVMGKIATLIALTHLKYTGEEITQEEFARVSHASFPLIEKLSKVRIEEDEGYRRPKFIDTAFGGWDRFWGWQATPPADFLELIKKNGQLQLDFSELGQSGYDKDGESKEKDAGCPAFIRIKKGEQSPAERLWHWYVDLVKEEFLDSLLTVNTIYEVQKAHGKAG